MVSYIGSDLFISFSINDLISISLFECWNFNVSVFNSVRDRILGKIVDYTSLSMRWNAMRVTCDNINNWIEEHISDQWLYIRINDNKIYPWQVFSVLTLKFQYI